MYLIKYVSWERGGATKHKIAPAAFLAHSEPSGAKERRFGVAGSVCELLGSSKCYMSTPRWLLAEGT